MEKGGISTACLALVRSVAEQLRAPRMLSVPFPFGHALGDAHDAVGQRHVLQALLSLLEHDGPGPLLADYVPR